MQEGTGGEELVAAFAQWAEGQRLSAAASGRSRERSLRALAAASATLVGVLVDLAEREARVAVSAGGVQRSGRIVGVGADFCVLDAGAAGGASLVVTAALSTVWPEGRSSGPAGGSRVAALEMSLGSALSLLAEERTPVRLALRGGEQLAGELSAAGDDVVTVTVKGGRLRHAHVAVSALAVCDLV